MIIYALITITICKYVDNVKLHKSMPKHVDSGWIQVPRNLAGRKSRRFPEGGWKLQGNLSRKPIEEAKLLASTFLWRRRKS